MQETGVLEWIYSVITKHSRVCSTGKTAVCTAASARYHSSIWQGWGPTEEKLVGNLAGRSHRVTGPIETCESH